MSESTMEVSDDALKLLVAEHGVRGTARLLGMDETQTHTFRQRVTRGKWLADPAMIELRSKSEPPRCWSSGIACHRYVAIGCKCC